MKGYAPIEQDTAARETRQRLERALTGLGFKVEAVREDLQRNVHVIEFANDYGVYTMEIARTRS